jgi:hypothetical protein
MSANQYSPTQANAALPLVRQIASDVVRHQARLLELVTQFQKKKRDASTTQVALNEARQQLVAVTGERDACVAELAELGVLLKDASTGLLDFPSELDGEPVLLCWRLGEESVEHYHTEAEGFAGRRPIPVPAHV